MTPPVVASQRLRFKFVLRFDHMDRKEKTRKLVEKYGLSKLHIRVADDRTRTPAAPKIDVHVNFGPTSPVPVILFGRTALRVTSRNSRLNTARALNRYVLWILPNVPVPVLLFN